MAAWSPRLGDFRLAMLGICRFRNLVVGEIQLLQPSAALHSSVHDHWSILRHYPSPTLSHWDLELGKVRAAVRKKPDNWLRYRSIPNFWCIRCHALVPRLQSCMLQRERTPRHGLRARAYTPTFQTCAQSLRMHGFTCLWALYA